MDGSRGYAIHSTLLHSRALCSAFHVLLFVAARNGIKVSEAKEDPALISLNSQLHAFHFSLTPATKSLSQMIEEQLEKHWEGFE